MAELDLAGNFANRGSQFLEWLNDGDVDIAGLRVVETDEQPFHIGFRGPKGDYETRVWTDSTDRKRMTQNRPDYMVAAPGNSLYTDLARLRDENRALRMRLETEAGRDAAFVERKRALIKREQEVSARESIARERNQSTGTSLAQVVRARFGGRN